METELTIRKTAVCFVELVQANLLRAIISYRELKLRQLIFACLI